MEIKRSLLGVIVLVEAVLTSASVLVSDPNRTTIVEINAGGQPCKIVTDGALISSILQSTDPSQILAVSAAELANLTNSCSRGSPGSSIVGFVYPGTKWCGPGNVAADYNDLGSKSDLDRCCRQHDHCPAWLEPGQCRRGICNISPFTRSHCDCDRAFKKCLQEVNSNDSRIIATLYFNIAQVPCFQDRRSCPQWMRNDVSYTWFCDEWKYVPVDNFIPLAEKETKYNEVPVGGKRKPLQHSKIDHELHELYRTDEDIEKIMDNPKSSPKYITLNANSIIGVKCGVRFDERRIYRIRGPDPFSNNTREELKIVQFA